VPTPLRRCRRFARGWPSSRSVFPRTWPGRVTYDPTTFVTATIEEVEKTLIEAFVLVRSNFAILERYFHIEQREGDRIHLGLTDHGRKVGA
jgi:hypothetical protein